VLKFLNLSSMRSSHSTKSSHLGILHLKHDICSIQVVVMNITIPNIKYRDSCRRGTGVLMGHVPLCNTLSLTSNQKKCHLVRALLPLQLSPLPKFFVHSFSLLLLSQILQLSHLISTSPRNINRTPRSH
jgi:hypothetical protein